MKYFPFIALILVAVMTVTLSGQTNSLDPALSEAKSYFVFSPDGKYLVKAVHSENDTWIRVHETQEMKTLAQWQIHHFKVHTIRFSHNDPSKLLLADRNQLLVYRLIDEKQKLIFLQPKIPGQEIVRAQFDLESDEIVWATKSIVYRTNTEEQKQQEVMKVPWEEGEIKTVASIGKDDFAVNLEGSRKILLLSESNSYKPVELIGHTTAIVGLHSSKANQLISLDENYELIFWDTATRQPLVKVSLNKPLEDAKLLGFSLDDPNTSLRVLSQAKNEFIGQQYRISDLESGKTEPERLPLTMTAAGNVYTFSAFKIVDRLFQTLKSAAQIKEQQDSDLQPPPSQKKQNSLYDLAKIEADNGGYEASLELIKRIALDDPEYGKSRELKRKVYAAIDIQNSISSAREQVTKANYQAAKILLENALAKHPDSEELDRQMELVEDKLDETSWFSVFLNLFLLIMVALLAYVFWKNPAYFLRQTAELIGRTGKLFNVGSMNGPRQGDENGALRRQFVYKLDETRKALHRANANDTDRKHKNTWLEMTARLNTMEKRARLNDTYLSEFLIELEKILAAITRLVSSNERKSTFQFEKESTAKPNPVKESTAGSHQDKESTAKPNRDREANGKPNPVKESTARPHRDKESTAGSHRDKESTAGSHRDKESTAGSHRDKESTAKPNQDRESTKNTNKQQQEKTERKESEKPKQPEPQPKMPDYYEILGVSRKAKLDEIKRAYRQKMKDYHPDRHNSSDFTWVKEEADRRTKLVQEAYNKLSDLLK